MGDEMIKVSIPDGAVIETPVGTTPVEIMKIAGEKLPKAACIAELDGESVELNRPLSSGGKLAFPGFDEPRGAEAYRHTTAHVMAQAVKRLYPQAKLPIGPAIQDGYY